MCKLNWQLGRDLVTRKADYYHTSGGAITNFSEKLPSRRAAKPAT